MKISNFNMNNKFLVLKTSFSLLNIKTVKKKYYYFKRNIKYIIKVHLKN